MRRTPSPSSTPPRARLRPRGETIGGMMIERHDHHRQLLPDRARLRNWSTAFASGGNKARAATLLKYPSRGQHQRRRILEKNIGIYDRVRPQNRNAGRLNEDQADHQHSQRTWRIPSYTQNVQNTFSGAITADISPRKEKEQWPAHRSRRSPQYDKQKKAGTECLEGARALGRSETLASGKSNLRLDLTRLTTSAADNKRAPLATPPYPSRLAPSLPVPVDRAPRFYRRCSADDASPCSR